ncbi:VIT family protein [Ramlibacter ginsenosidimutans]|uniref:VIT family protein n=1 Tax=Ramlibacter ginsenosidimutans TaxID=502333 RepID=A0A934TTB9_9BURK|nr:VIT family protein [Ramlibacter ginsenosidimutans]MBK6006900.1 VIT family protein [Ramlibacter ginsenosidimutans]
MRHSELHRSGRIGWLRAAVLGANDGIVSTASLVLGVAAGGAAPAAIMMAGIAGTVAGAMSMAAGEYVSVSSQLDTEKSDLGRERQELQAQPAAEQQELAGIYVARGVDRDLAAQVATQLMAKDALEAHARDELGISHATRARPVQAAFASAGSFTAGAVVPLLVAALLRPPMLAAGVTALSLALLVVLGGVAARAGGASAALGAGRVGLWGALAMALTYGVGALFGAVV